MAQADAEDRQLAQQLADRLLGVVQRLGVAGPVGEEHAVGLAAAGPPPPWPCPAGSSRGSPCRTGAGRCSTSCRSPRPRRAATELATGCGGRPPAAPNAPAARSTRSARSGMTSRTRSRPTSPGLALAFWTSRASSRSALEARPSSPRGSAAGGPAPGCRCLPSPGCRSG